MRRILAVPVLTLLVAACSTDTFVSPDAAAPDAGPTGTTIACTGVPAGCKAGIEMCCKLISGSVDLCVPKPADPPETCKGGLGFAAACDDAADCPTDMICCATPQSVAYSSRCTLKADCTSPKMILCDPNVAKPCETGSCVPITNASGNRCQ